MLVLSSLLLVQGCSTLDSQNTNSIPSDSITYIANDFARSLPHVRGKATHEATLAMSEGGDPFGVHLLSALQKEGYSILTTQDKSHKNYISYTTDQFEENNEIKITYRLKVGHLQLIRQYSLQKPKLIPSSVMAIEGDIFLNSSKPQVITNSGNALPAPNHRKDDKPPQLLSSQAALNNAPLPNKTPIKNKLNSDKLFTKKIKPSPTPPDKIIPKKIYNVNELGKSNYQQILSNYTLFDSYTFEFNNESSDLTENNKKQLAKIIKSFNKDTDIISVVGYSRGHTKIINGNAILAAKRADNIRSALIENGGPPAKIFQEPFWSDKAPRGQMARGAKLSIFRQSH